MKLDGAAFCPVSQAREVVIVRLVTDPCWFPSAANTPPAPDSPFNLQQLDKSTNHR